MPKNRILLQSFSPESYQLHAQGDGTARILIVGQKVGRPSKRITLHQKKLKVLNAKIWRLDKNGEQELPVSRINHHQGFEEVRLHSDQMLFPGNYRLQIAYRLPEDGFKRLKSGKLDRSLAPIIDEAEATHEATVQV